jgi:hypothetical protein
MLSCRSNGDKLLQNIKKQLSVEPGSSQGGLQAAANNKIALVNIKNGKNASGEYKNTKKVQQIMSNSNKNV